MKVCVTEKCMVHVDQTTSVTYSPSDEPITAPREHIAEIERQGKGKRVDDEAPGGEHPAA